MTDMPRELNADALFHLLLRRWRWAAFVLPLTLFAAGLAWSRVPDRYQSGGRLLIQDQQTVNPFLEELFEDEDEEHTATESVFGGTSRASEPPTPRSVSPSLVHPSVPLPGGGSVDATSMHIMLSLVGQVRELTSEVKQLKAQKPKENDGDARKLRLSKMPTPAEGKEFPTLKGWMNWLDQSAG